MLPKDRHYLHWNLIIQSILACYFFHQELGLAHLDIRRDNLLVYKLDPKARLLYKIINRDQHLYIELPNLGYYVTLADYGLSYPVGYRGQYLKDSRIVLPGSLIIFDSHGYMAQVETKQPIIRQMTSGIRNDHDNRSYHSVKPPSTEESHLVPGLLFDRTESTQVHQSFDRPEFWSFPRHWAVSTWLTDLTDLAGVWVGRYKNNNNPTYHHKNVAKLDSTLSRWIHEWYPTQIGNESEVDIEGNHPINLFGSPRDIIIVTPHHHKLRYTTIQSHHCLASEMLRFLWDKVPAKDPRYGRCYKVPISAQDTSV
jgi:hypothetical protein